MYIIKGDVMNAYSHLTGNNAYPHDLSIVCVDWSKFAMTHYDQFCLDRFKILGRWLDDVCDNNERREREKEEN